MAADGSTPATRASLLLAPAPQAKNNELFLDVVFSSLKQLGIDCVRLFLLADGVNLNPPTIDKNGIWQVTNSDVTTTNQVQDFATVLDVCVRQKMQIMPVFVDYLLFSPPAAILRHFDVKSLLPNVLTSDVPIPPGTTSVDDFVNSFYKKTQQAGFRDDSKSVDWHKFIKGGRAPILRNPKAVTSFLNDTLVPLLKISSSSKYKDQVLAWDIINEPEVAIELAQKSKDDSGWLGNLSDPVGGIALADFILQSAKLILKAGMNATVGFQTAMPLDKDDGFKSQHLIDGVYDGVGKEISKITKVVTKLLPLPNFFPQCHYYPSDCAGGSEQNKLLSKKDFGLRAGNPLILGEFATKIDGSSGKSPWGNDIPGYDSVNVRLLVVESKGYDWAFPWSATNGIVRSRFDAPTQAQYEMFRDDKQLLPVTL